MMRVRTFLSLLRDKAGSMVVETALVTPVLAILSIGIVETSLIVARQHELQSATNEIQMIAIAANQGAETSPGELKNILRDSLDLGENDVKVRSRYRCNNETNLRNSSGPCKSDDVVSTYIEITIQDTYKPSWKDFGLGEDIEFKIERTIQMS